MTGQAIKFSNPNITRLGKHIAYAASLNLPMPVEGSHRDSPGALIVAQGPTVQGRGVLGWIRRYANKGYTVFGIKESIAWLEDKGITVHYSVAMDPMEYQVGRTPVYPHVTYCIASSCHPKLFDHVLAGGAKVMVFHSACGWVEKLFQPGLMFSLGGDQMAVVPGQMEMKTTEGNSFSPVCMSVRDEVTVYRGAFPSADVMIGGFTVGNRALGLAKYMGFENVVMAGMDFGWRDDGTGEDGKLRYASFVKYAGLKDLFMNDKGRVDGKPWRTRPDLLASAVDVAKHIKKGQVKVLGDSLANAFAKKDDDYLDKVVRIQG